MKAGLIVVGTCLALASTSCASPRDARPYSASLTAPPAGDAVHELAPSTSNSGAGQRAAFAPVVRNAFGVTRTDAYSSVSHPRLSDRPYASSAAVKITSEYSFLGVADFDGLAALSRVVVRGVVTDLGRPHFNSSDGGFWDPKIHDEPGIPDVDAFIMRDVTLRVGEIYGSKLTGVQAGKDLLFSIRGGQVSVTLTSSQAKELGLAGAGTYIFTSDNEVNFGLGDELVVFLNSTPVHGLYDGHYAYHYAFFPAQEQHFAFDEVAGNLEDLSTSAQRLTAPLDEVRAAIIRNLGVSAGPEPLPGLFPELPDPGINVGPSASETSEPSESPKE